MLVDAVRIHKACVSMWRIDILSSLWLGSLTVLRVEILGTTEKNRPKRFDVEYVHSHSNTLRQDIIIIILVFCLLFLTKSHLEKSYRTTAWKMKMFHVATVPCTTFFTLSLSLSFLFLASLYFGIKASKFRRKESFRCCFLHIFFGLCSKNKIVNYQSRKESPKELHLI